MSSSKHPPDLLAAQDLDQSTPTDDTVKEGVVKEGVVKEGVVKEGVVKEGVVKRLRPSYWDRWYLGLTRNGVIAAERFGSSTIARAGLVPVSTIFMGSLFIGLGVSMFVRGRLGVPAYDVLATGLRDSFDISLGQAGWLLNGTLLVIAALLGRLPSWSTVLYVGLNGVFIDVFLSLVKSPDPMMLRVLFVLLGTLSIAAGVSLVLNSGLSGGPTELLMRVGSDRGLDPFKVRRYIDIGIVLSGIALGGELGLATGFFVFAMSPLIKAGELALADHKAGREMRHS